MQVMLQYNRSMKGICLYIKKCTAILGYTTSGDMHNVSEEIAGLYQLSPTRVKAENQG